MSESPSGAGEAPVSTEAGGKSVTCPTCGKNFIGSSGLYYHYKSDSNDCRGIQCPQCGGRGLKNERGLKLHQTRNNCVSHDFECPECEKSYPRSGTLTNHMRDCCPGKLLDCPWCGEGFRTRKAVEVHHKEKHGEKISGTLVNCSWCSGEHRVSDSKLERNDEFYCSKECYGNHWSERIRGENHPRWTELQTVYGPDWEEVGEKVRKEFDYRCQGCGIHQDDLDMRLDVHHITPAKYFDTAEEANSSDNLIAMCRSCHMRYEGIPLIPKLLS